MLTQVIACLWINCQKMPVTSVPFLITYKNIQFLSCPRLSYYSNFPSRLGSYLFLVFVSQLFYAFQTTFRFRLNYSIPSPKNYSERFLYIKVFTLFCNFFSGHKLLRSFKLQLFMKENLACSDLNHTQKVQRSSRVLL